MKIGELMKEAGGTWGNEAYVMVLKEDSGEVFSVMDVVYELPSDENDWKGLAWIMVEDL